jgi:GntR family transcriptional regulator/MocR family aminotransferase
MDLQLDLAGTGPLRRRLEHALRAAIRSGRLSPGAALPPSRVLAHQLGVSRGVVVESYAQLIAEGYLTARRGSATRVTSLPAPWRDPAPRVHDGRGRIRYELRPGQADFHAFPRRRWQAALLHALRELPDQRLSYGPHAGAPELRTTISAYLGRARAVAVEPDRVVVCAGVSHALSALWYALRGRGARRVAIEDPGWRWQRFTVEHAGLEAVPVRVDASGLIVGELAAADCDAVVVTPAHHYPTGVVMTPDRRSELIAWARDRRALIVEDDYDAEYRYDRHPVASLQGLAPDHVAFAGTISKTLAPALRLGWIVPPAGLLDDVERHFLLTGVTPATVDQLALDAFINNGSLDRHLRLMRRRYRAKRDVMIDALTSALPGTRIAGAAAGLHVLAQLPDGTDERSTGVRARELGVAVHELHRHCTAEAPWPSALLLGYALATEAEIREGVRVLAGALRPPPSSAAAPRARGGSRTHATPSHPRERS